MLCCVWVRDLPLGGMSEGRSWLSWFDSLVAGCFWSSPPALWMKNRLWLMPRTLWPFERWQEEKKTRLSRCCLCCWGPRWKKGALELPSTSTAHTPTVTDDTTAAFQPGVWFSSAAAEVFKEENRYKHTSSDQRFYVTFCSTWHKIVRFITRLHTSSSGLFQPITHHIRSSTENIHKHIYQEIFSFTSAPLPPAQNPSIFNLPFFFPK